MNYNTNIRLITFLCIFTVIIAFPLYLFAENEKGIEHETGFYYTIQKGDTLWDISERFFDSAWQWPDLWEKNSQVSNPHLVYPGERIRLFHKGWVKTTAKTDVTEKSLQVKEPQKEPPYLLYKAIDSIGFIKKEPVTSSGYILKSYEDKIMISHGDKVYLRQNNNTSFIPGEKYTIYRTIHPVIDKKTKAFIGIQHYITGILEITEKKPDFAIAKVLKSFRSIAVNDFLMPYKQQSPKIFITKSKEGLEGTILGAEEKATIIGDSAIAFIDRGNQDGVMPGQYYSIYYQEKKRLDPKSKKYTLLSIVDFGTLFVLRTEQTTSTVLITRSDKSITPGAKICSPLPKK
ncbi:MAG: LysM peptidoglycan-binding domain-containing protein [Desulfobacterales bacterium]|uniref:LysM peptidoglycan-binding domain-containing protein n=1 Tax=Candidatus Desulfaltia bathyphila TaxID=2841697 RepID=A0A8J6TCF8_9BACT|nr:LysM peptidoglycan-binding domain-containing protein [Candidatus Desulfaltia bathyphila]MBL7195160.1 LysM peptidoglycan-binding domain-containing protein [Desulfobacterales bacterium]MBL7208025.1 LysM peptidoglycan-binding domain-containing protein [Desulfobacterales bacterium]